MSQEWSRVVSAEVKEEYMTLQGIQTHCSQLTSKNPKTVKSHLSLTLMRVKLVRFISMKVRAGLYPIECRSSLNYFCKHLCFISCFEFSNYHQFVKCKSV